MWHSVRLPRIPECLIRMILTAIQVGDFNVLLLRQGMFAKGVRWASLLCVYIPLCVCVCVCVCVVKLTFEMLTVRGETTFISTHERMFLWKCRSFWDRNCFYLRGTRIPNLRIQAEYSNHLNYHGQTFAVPSHVFNAGLGGIDTFCSKVTI